MDKGFPSQWRIRTTAQFQHVYAKRQRLFGQYYVLYYRGNKFKHARLGTVASKRKVRSAVRRNRFKRLVREVFRIRKSNWPAVDVIVVAKPQSARATKQELSLCLNKLFKQLSMRHESSCS